MSDRTKPGVPE